MVSLPLVPLCIVAAAVSLALRFRRSTGIERQQVKWIAYAAGLIASGTGLANQEDAMVFKLPDSNAHARALALEGSHLFDPGGKGRPTPKRRDAQSKRRGPATPPPRRRPTPSPSTAAR